MADNAPNWLSIVREKVDSLRYGVVQIVVHNSRVTQIERTEKVRLGAQDEDHFTNQPDILEKTKLNGAISRTTGRRS